MKRKNLKALKLISSLLSISAIGYVISPIIATKENSISRVDVKTNSTPSTGTSGWQEETLTFTVEANPYWKQKIFAYDATNELIKDILKPNKQYGANYSVKLLPITDDMKRQGYVEFVVKQIKNQYTNGVTTGTTITEFINPTSEWGKTNSNGAAGSTINSGSTTKVEVDGEQVDDSKIWSTKSKSLFLQQKYSFKWNSDSEIGDFLLKTDKKDLSSEDILNNFVSTADSTDLLPKETKGTFDQNFSTTSGFNTTSGTDTISSQDAKQFGVGEINVTFDSAAGNKTGNNQDWVNGNKPSADQTKRIVRGLVGSDNKKHTVKLNLEDSSLNTFKNTQLNLDAIKKQNPAFSYSGTNSGSNQTVTISQLTPSQIINALNGDLTSLLTTTNYIANSANSSSNPLLPAIYVTYMNKNAFTDPALPFKGTGLSKQKNVPYVDENYNPIMNGDSESTTGETSVNNLMNITNVKGVANDAEGQLELKITYNYYDIYKNVLISDYEVPYTITGLQVNESTDKNLFFGWKSVENLPFNSSSYLEKLYTDNQNDQTYLKDLSNSLFFGSNDAYQMDRKVEITKNARNKAELTVKLTFPYFGEEKEKVLQTTFKFATDTASSGIKFKSKAVIEETVGSFSDKTPQSLINDISNGTYSSEIFVNEVNGVGGDQVILTPNASNDGIIVQVISNKVTYWNAYNGFKKGQSGGYVYDFSFTPSNASNPDFDKLKNIPLQEITKQNVIDLYLKHLSPFNVSGSEFSLTEDDVELVIDEKTGSLTVKVLIHQFDQDKQDVNRTFQSTLLGFNNQNLVDNNSFVKPLDLTIPLSATLAAVSTIALSVLLGISVKKRMKLKKAKKVHEKK